MKRNIILVGFMGVGKGTIARALVKKTNLFAVDSDDLIESMENRKIKKIFESDGEEYFRALEQKTANWIESSLNNTIISVGGGFYKVKNLKNLGKVVLLDAPFDWIYKRLLDAPNSEKKLKKRPLFRDLTKAKELYETRESEYKKVADLIVSVDSLSEEEAIEEILSFYQKV
jgi:shikimate kinase